jgi:hypothetical protein
MQMILNVDAIQPPLTGIGHYVLLALLPKNRDSCYYLTRFIHFKHLAASRPS